MAFQVIGPDADTVTRFLNDLRTALGDTAALVEKGRADDNARYTIHRLRRDGGYYSIEGRTDEERPAAKALWYASLAPVRTYAANMSAMVSPRVFRHESGSITCRSDDIATAVRILGIVAQEASGWTVPDGAAIHSSPAPAFRQTLAYDHDAFCRVLAKMGLNIIAKTSGLAAMRQRDFDRARAYVLHGRPRLLTRSGYEGQIPEALEPLAQDRHLIGIEVERRAGMEAVRAVSRLYGGPVDQVRLAGACGRSISVTPVWLSVDYVNHRVERH